MIQFIDALNSNPWSGFLLNATMKSLVIFAVAGVLAFLLRGKSAALRSLVWYMAILGCLMVSVFFLTHTPYEIGVLPGKPVGFEVDVPLENNQPSSPSVPAAPRPLPTTAASSPHAIPPPVGPEPEAGESEASQFNGSGTAFVSLHWTNWIALIWAAVGLFLFARLAVGVGTVWRITARSDDFGGSIRDLRLGSQVGSWRRPVGVRRSDGVTAPIMWGLFRPTILLPADADNWGEDRLRAVLLHELAHVRRNDWESQLIAQMMCAVYWFNPLVWFAARRMRIEAERACDDYVLSSGYQSTDYAQHLIDIVRTVKKAGSVSRAAVAIVRPSKIEERIRMILAENLNRRPLTKVAVVVGYCVVIFFAGLIGTARLAEAISQEAVLLQKIRTAIIFRSDPLPENMTGAERATRLKEHRQNVENALRRCDQFLKAYPESEQYDEVYYRKLIQIHNLGHAAEFEAGVENFLSERPFSEYAADILSLRAFHLESEFKFEEALMAWDKIDDPEWLHKIYDGKWQIYSRMGNWEKQKEYEMLRAELILGKPASEFSHTSVFGVPVSLSNMHGKVVVLYHWSTIDGETVPGDKTGGEIARIKRFYAMYGDNPDFVLICVCTDNSEAKFKEFVNTHAMPGIHLLLESRKVPHRLGVVYSPHYVVLDKAGILRESAKAWELEDLEIEQLIEALLAEDINPFGERIIPRISRLRAEVYRNQNQADKAIAEYEKLLDFIPNNLHAMMQILSNQREETGETAELMNRAYEQIVRLSHLPADEDLVFCFNAVELAEKFSMHGDREKTWNLFQIAVAHDFDNLRFAIKTAKGSPGQFAAIQDMPEFQKLLADTPQTDVEKYGAEVRQKWEMHEDELFYSLKSFAAVEADGELFTGVVLTRVGHILVPATVTEAKVLKAKIDDYQPAKVVAIDAESGLAIIMVDGQKFLRPVVLGTVDDLREFALISRPNRENGGAYHIYPDIPVICVYGHRNKPHLPAEIQPDGITSRQVSVMQLDTDDRGAVTSLKVMSPGPPGEFIKGAAAVYYDGRLLAISPENEVKHANWGPSTDPIPIDQIRAALKRMGMIQLMNRDSG